MSCSAGRPTFRLLNSLVGWTDVRYSATTGGWVTIVPPGASAPLIDPAKSLDLSDGIQLSLESGTNAPNLLGAFPPLRLARGCGTGAWLLLTPSGMILRNTCKGPWRPIWRVEHHPEGLEGAVALATSVDRLAIVTPEGVQIWTIAGETQVADIPLKGATAVAFCPYGSLLVATTAVDGNILLQHFGPAGNPLDPAPLETKIPGPIQGLAVTPTAKVGETIWLVTGPDLASLALSIGPIEGKFGPATAGDLASAAFPATGLVGESQFGFALQETGADGASLTSYISWEGCPIPASCVLPPTPPTWNTLGSITSGWIDSGISRCIWHRVRVDADMPLPQGTGIAIQVATTDFDPLAANFVGPSKSDWQTAPAGALDFLVQQPPGQFLQLKLDLTSDGTTTPVVHSVRIDFPRRTSLDWLPAVYRENVEAEDFTERFLANFDASIGDVDAAIKRFPALLEPDGVPGVVLPWLASFLGVVFDPTWCDTLRRNILKQLPQLYAQRGTLAGLMAAIKLVFVDIEPAIVELAAQRSWGALGDSSKTGADAPVQPNAVLGSVRLFGKARTRFRLGHSALGVAPMHAYGNPDLDPLNAEAYRFEVQIPRASSNVDHARLKALIDSQKPAHTAVTVRYGGEGFVVGVWSSVGIDTAFTSLPPPVLGASGNVRLRRTSVVAEGTPRGRLPLAIGVSSVVGVQTLLE